MDPGCRNHPQYDMKGTMSKASLRVAALSALSALVLPVGSWGTPQAKSERPRCVMQSSAASEREAWRQPLAMTSTWWPAVPLAFWAFGV